MAMILLRAVSQGYFCVERKKLTIPLDNRDLSTALEVAPVGTASVGAAEGRILQEEGN